MDSQFLTFVGIATLAIITPGPDMALVMKNSLAGRRHGTFTALGVVLGQLIWFVAASAGVASVLLASEPLFNVVKLAGAAYLIFLGAQALISAFRRRISAGSPEMPESNTHERSVSWRTSFPQGLIGNLGNPKMAVFATSLLPQFVSSGEASFLAFFSLGLTFCSITLIWLLGYASVISYFGDILRRPGVRRVIESLTGAALVALGLRLATEHR